MAQQTSVEWFLREIGKHIDTWNIPDEVIEKAYEMHKQEITKTSVQCHFEGVRQKAKNSEEYLNYAEEHYNQLFKNK